MTEKNFLLVGGLGYIGQVLQQELKAAGHDFVIADNDLLNLHEWEDKVDIINYGHFDKLSEHISKADITVNLAAVVGDQACLVDTRMAISINCQGVQHIINLCNRFKKKVIHMSTCSIYGASNGLLMEGSQTFPVDFYGQTKYQQERYVLENAKDYCVLRLGTAYGWSPRMRFDLVTNTFTAQAFNKEKLVVHGGGQWRPMVHIRDAARAIIFAAEHDLQGIYNVTNENITLLGLSQLIADGKVPVEVNELMSDPRNYKVDNGKLLATGFTYAWNLRKGVEDMDEHPNDLKNYKHPKYSNYKMMMMKKLST